MMDESEIQKVKDIVSNQIKFGECKERIRLQEPSLYKWILDSAQVVAIDEVTKVPELLGAPPPQHVIEALTNRLRNKMVSCIMAGFIASEVHGSSEWNKELGIDGTTVYERKFSAFVEGMLPEKYYEGIEDKIKKKKNQILEKALVNFNKRKVAMEEAEIVAKQIVEAESKVEE